ncbi:phosphogluconate dehydratase [Chitinimonas sp. BJB300]|uniref:phosphogluconate dehydratase n=1 Tax=Chitinimonas sp. BJB300 TaxID=1559339 RepID=UPI000C0CDDE7|nr:phosphogluconate dehydratase [Chitinimonas sp. BJB300]PHV11840.1 phosphogluconate dehydratase [Chitinimonas sp. BJB300]TSJ88632.1 phosphogluconate dehydratase [Chitinimonas sp. BJB300]
MNLHPRLVEVTERIVQKSRPTRAAYLARVAAWAAKEPVRKGLSCTNLAHAYAASPAGDKIMLREQRQPNLAIVSAYNDMLSAHQPLETYPELLKTAAREAGATAQFAGGVPAMCDGVTQGQAGMELSLFSRDIIAMSTAVALSHQMFDGMLCLGVCDKIVPGLMIGALQFGHLPAIFVPAGPMVSGLENKEKARIRQLYAEGKIGREGLLEAEEKSYHGAGTCTFYGTANSNQMLMEIMGVHLPSSAFVNPETPLRDAFTREAAKRAAAITALGNEYIPLAEVIDERAIVNGLVGLMATGGSTNHAIHMVAIAAAAGIIIDWTDFDDISAIIPLLAKIYPNGGADVNHFHAAGGMGYLISQLLDAGLLHEDVKTVMGPGLRRYAVEPHMTGGVLAWRPAPTESQDKSVLSSVAAPFQADGGLRLVQGNLGRGVIKVSAVQPAHRVVEAPAIVFDSQDALIDAFKHGELEKDFVAVIRFQGPRANGMPELHKLTPSLGVLQDRGFKVALVTDGRMSGASGKVPAAIHVTPECLAGGPLSKVNSGDVIRLDAEAGTLDVLVPDEAWTQREPATADMTANQYGYGRDLFAVFRSVATGAEQGAMSFMLPK